MLYPLAFNMLYCFVTEAFNWECKDCVGFVMVDHKETYVSFEGHVWKGPGEVII
jgi:hypothetical protein